MRISDWNSDVCSSDLLGPELPDLRRQRLLDLLDLAVGHVLRQGLDHRAEHPRRVAPALVTRPHALQLAEELLAVRSEERRVGKQCVSTCRARWSPYL